MIDNTKKPYVYFGRLAASKGIELCICAAHVLFKRDPMEARPLWIIGGNDNEINELRAHETLRPIIRTLEDQALIFWWGHLPHQFLPFVLRKCAFFCFTSKYEPGGRTILEAMASGLPVLATPHGFAREIIISGKNGIIIEEDTPESWAEAMQLLIGDEKKTKKMGLAAKKTVIAKYTMQSFMERHWDIYNQFTPGYNSDQQND